MKLGLIPGHNNRSRGAVNYRGESEYPWATRILKMAMPYMPKIECQLFTRDNGGIAAAIKRAKEAGCIATVELHFNAASGDPSKDIEVLVDSRSPKSVKFAKYVAKRQAEEYPGFGLRHDEGAKIDPGRGGNNVAQGVKYGIEYCVLWEPQFGHERNEDAMELFEDDERFARFIGKVMTDFFTEEGLIAEDSPEVPNAEDDHVIADEEEATLDGLIEAIKNTTVFEFPNLKTICLSQYILESGRVRSELARVHYNFGGIKWRGDLGVEGVEPVIYSAHDGIDTYVKCDSYETYFKYYWAFLSRERYNGWKDAARISPVDFLEFILAKGYCPSTTYMDKIQKILPEAAVMLKDLPIEPSEIEVELPASNPHLVTAKDIWDTDGFFNKMKNLTHEPTPERIADMRDTVWPSAEKKIADLINQLVELKNK